MAADEGLGFIISVAVDAETVQPALTDVEGKVASTVDRVNTQLQQLGATDVFQGIVRGAELAGLSVQQLSAGLETASGLLRIFEESQRLAQTGMGMPVTRIGGLTAADVEAQRALIEEQRRLAASPAATTDVGGLTSMAVGAQTATEAIARLDAELDVTRAKQESVAAAAQRTAEALTQQAAAATEAGDPTKWGRGLPFTGGTQPGTAFLSDAEEAEIAASTAKARVFAEQQAVGRARPTDVAGNDRLFPPGASISLAQDFNALAQAMGEGAAAFEGKSIIAVRQAWQGINGTIEPGFYNARTGEPLGPLDELYYGSRSKFMNAEPGAQAGGGGFFGGIGRGFTTAGFGGSQGGGGLEEAGFQLGMVAQYTIYYELFRQIQDMIKASVQDTIAFERSVTDLANEFGTTRDQVRGLATDLGNVAAQSGLAPNVGVQLGSMFAGRFAGQGDQAQLAMQGATLGSQLSLLTGGKPETDLNNAASAVQAFNLTAGDTQRVLDASTVAAQRFLGAMNPELVLPGLAQIGDLANQAGLSVEQMANAIAAIQSRTGETSDAAAGELRRFLGREGNSAFQQVFAREGINTTLPFQEELDQLSKKFDTLSEREREFIVGQFGGGRAGAAALALLEDYDKIVNQTGQDLNTGGAFQRAYAQRLSDIAGEISQIKGAFKELATSIGETGLAAPFGLLLATIKPTLDLLNDLLAKFHELQNAIPGGSALTTLAIGGGELVGGVALASKLGLGKRARNVGGRLNEMLGGGAAAETVATDTAQAEASAAAATASAALAETLSVLDTALQAGITTEAEVRTTMQAVAASAARAAEALGAVATTGGALAAEQETQAATGLLSRIGSGIGGVLSSNVGALGITGGVVAEATWVDSLYNAVKQQRDAESKANQDAITGTTSDQLRAAASRLGTEGSRARQSSGGIVGSLENFISGLEGQGTTEQAASRVERLSRLATLEANRLDSARRHAADLSGGDYSTQIDVSGQTGVTQSIKNLQAQGLSATQVLDALNERLHAFTAASEGSANTLARGQAVLVAQQVANATTNQLSTFTGLDIAARGAGVDSISKRQADAADRFSRLNLASLNTALTDTVSSYLTSEQPTGAGLAGGGEITKGDIDQVKQQAIGRTKSWLKDHGFSAKDIASLNGDITLAVTQSVRDQVANLNASRGQKISPDEVGQIVQAAPQLVQQAATEAQLAASVGGDSRGGALAGAQAGLAQARQILTSLQRTPGTDATQLQTINQLVDQMQIAANQALISHTDALGKLAVALTSPFDKDGRIHQQLSTLQKELSTPGLDADTKNQLAAQIADLQAQQAQQALDDVNAQLALGARADDPYAQAAVKLAQDRNTLNAITATGVHSGADYSNALRAVQDDRIAQYRELMNNENANRSAHTRSGDPLEESRTNLTNALASLSADGKGSTQYYNDLAAVHKAEEELASQIADRAKTTSLLRGDTTDAVGQAQAALQQAIAKRAQDSKYGVGDQAADFVAVEQAQWAKQKAAFDQQMNDQQSAYNLHEESASQYLNFLDSQDKSLRKQLTGMKKGSEGYRQLYEELQQVDQAIVDTTNQMSGQFNLGDIKMPTVYDVRRQVAASANGGSIIDNSVNNINTTINGADFQRVIDYLNQVLGANAASARSPVSTRKVAA